MENTKRGDEPVEGAPANSDLALSLVPPFLEIQISPEGDRYPFGDVEQIRNFLQEELGAWKWLSNAGTRNQNLQSTWQRHSEGLNRVMGLLESYDQTSNQVEKAKFLEVVKGAFQTHFIEKRHLFSKAPLAQFIFAKRVLDEEVAAHILACHYHGHPVETTPRAMMGSILGALFDVGEIGNVESERQGMAELRNSIRQETKEWKRQLLRNQKSLSELHELSEETLREEKVRFESQLQADIKRFEEAIVEHSREMEDIKATYDKKLALQSSVSYWSDREQRHKRLSVRYAIATFISMLFLSIGGFIAAMFLLYLGGQLQLASWHGWLPELTSVGSGENLWNWQLGIFVLLIFLGLWAVRVLVRLLLSHLHLHTDAQERGTMIKTYLAMLREGDGLTEKNKELILQTLFRPTHNGLIKDDAAPPNWFDLIRGRR